MHLLCATYAPIRIGNHRIVLIFSVSLRTVILVSIDSTSHNASMSLIQYLVSLHSGVQSQIEEFLEIEKVHQNGIFVIEGSYVSLTSVGKLLNKVVCIQTGAKKCGIY